MTKLNMTMMAQEAMDIGDHLLLMFMKRTLGEDPQMRLDVAKPDGPSTEGGKKARQPLSLVPVEGSGGKVMIGWLDVSQKRVEVRSHRVVVRQHEDRYGTELKIVQPEYDELVEDLSKFLQGRGFNVVVNDTMPKPKRAQPSPAAAVAATPANAQQGGPPWLWIGVSVAIGLGGLAAGALLF